MEGENILLKINMENLDIEYKKLFEKNRCAYNTHDLAMKLILKKCKNSQDVKIKELKKEK